MLSNDAQVCITGSGIGPVLHKLLKQCLGAPLKCIDALVQATIIVQVCTELLLLGQFSCRHMLVLWNFGRSRQAFGGAMSICRTGLACSTGNFEAANLFA